MKRSLLTLMLCIFSLIAFVGVSSAHFVMMIPSTDVVGKDDKKDLGLSILFTHPFEGSPLMQMDKPEKFGVVEGDKVVNLLDTLKEKKVDGNSTWETSFKITKPADYIFFLIPKPYWEAAEDKYILQVPKVIVDAMGAEEGWDKPIAKEAGIPAEIVPLTRPYSMYAGNVFTGQVQRDGKPVAGCDVEVEFWGKGKTKAPTESHVTQVVKTDENGHFSFAMPKAGWWGFSAIMEADKPMKHEGKDKKVELDAVLWAHAYPMK